MHLHIGPIYTASAVFGLFQPFAQMLLPIHAQVQRCISPIPLGGEECPTTETNLTANHLTISPTHNRVTRKKRPVARAWPFQGRSLHLGKQTPQRRKKRAPTSESERATVYYFPTLVRRPAGWPQPTIFRRLDRKCKNLDNAVIFVMEHLENHQRPNATIVAGPREMYIDEIKQRYEDAKEKARGRSPAPVSCDPPGCYVV